MDTVKEKIETEEKKTIRKIRMVKQKELPYAIEEALNRLRINVNFLGSDTRRIMVVSSYENEGKSFVALNLWQKLAENGIDTAFVDMDLRKSVLMEKYGIMETSLGKVMGTSYVLSHDCDFEGSMYATDWEHGFLLPNVDNVVNPSLLLGKERTGQFMEYLKDAFEVTILDCPPLGMVSDGERIAELCDGAILVVRSGVTSKSLVRQSVRQLERAGCPLLGVVLNRVGGAGSSYYYKKYGKYSKYGKYGYGEAYYGKNAE